MLDPSELLMIFLKTIKALEQDFHENRFNTSTIKTSKTLETFVVTIFTNFDLSLHGDEKLMEGK